MLLLIIIILLIILLFQFFKSYRIKLKTFFKKGIKVNRGRFGTYIYNGKQGVGKTASALQFILDNKNLNYPIYANLTSIKDLDYIYFNGLQGLLELQKQNVHNCIIFYDEIFSLLTKSDKITKDVLCFLSQMRKRNIIFITTSQEWLEIPMTLRRYCRYQVQCNIINLPLIGSISIKQVNDAENMKWSQDDNDYIAPLIINTISKLNYHTLNLYDTYETISPDNVVLPINISDYRKNNL